MTTTNTAIANTAPNIAQMSSRRQPKKWLFEKCLAEALKHTSISAWAAASDSSYRAAKRYNWMARCTKHMTKYPHWSREKCLATVAEFDTIAQWQSKNPESYRFARDTSEAFFTRCKKVIAKNSNRSVNRRWTKDAVLAEARKYNTVTEWHAKGAGSYRKAKSMKEDGWWSEATAHMSTPERPKRPYKWTKERCLKTAQQYSRKIDWLNDSPSSYQAADRYGWLEECTAHMITVH